MRFFTRAAMVAAVAAGLMAWAGTGSPALAQDAAAVPDPATLMPEIPNLDAWRQSPHADVKSEAFRHWDEDGVVEEACAKCHSTAGFQDFLGADGSAEGSIDSEHPTDVAEAPGIACMACHNDVAQNMTVVPFPSGEEVEVYTADARCMVCHAGRASTPDVEKAVADAGVGDDTPSSDLSFINVHYRAAAATRYGGEVRGGFEYEGMEYAGYFFHDQASQTCNDCHNPHTVEVKVATCVECHQEVSADDKESLLAIRTSKTDFDGNGDTSEGIHAEVDALHEQLYAAIQSYAKNVVGSSIAYNEHTYPYFLADTDDSGAIEDAENQRSNGFKSWTPRLLKAAYNFQFVEKDPGAYAHNPNYVIQLMHDSIADLATADDSITVPGERPE
ncbi:cytochrome c3 family protein [Consotaella aegiceratis]|uniref:cytochrome c3 family protein n=1 Tax=Consotaella aegiceratis TaxID=3097961 RepID=UPI002F3E3CB6